MIYPTPSAQPTVNKKVESAEGVAYTPFEENSASAEGVEYVPFSAEPAPAGPAPTATKAPGFLGRAGSALADSVFQSTPGGLLGLSQTPEDKADELLKLKGVPMPERTPTQEAVGRSAVNPDFVRAIKSRLDAMPEDKRAIALQNLTKQPGVYGVAARDIAAQYASADKAPPTIQELTDTRLEAQAKRHMLRGASPETARNIAMQDALMGLGPRPDLQTADRDVVGEVAGREAALRAKELEGAGFNRRVGAEVGAINTQTALGLQRIYADITGNKGLQAYTSDLSRVESERAGAIPEGESIFERSAQSAMASLVTQAPMLVLSALTGTAAPVLLQAGLTQLTQAYNESRNAGRSESLALARAVPMAAAEVFFERFGMTKALAGLKTYVAEGGSDIARYVAKSIATELPAELSTTASQYGIDALPKVGLENNPTLYGLYKQLEETLRQTVLQSGVTAGTTIGAVKGIQKLQSALEPKEPKGYKRDTSFDGLSELLARSKGFLSTPGQQNTTQPPATTVGAPDEERGPYEDADARAAKVEELAAYIESTGVPMEDAARMAERQMQDMEGEQAAKVQRSKDATARLVTSAPQGRIDELTQEYIDAGFDPQLALQQATQQATEEAEADAQAEKESRTRQKRTSNKPVATTIGTGVSVAEQPSAVATAEGTPGTEPDGVVSTGQDAGEPDAGTGAQPTAVKTEKTLLSFENGRGVVGNESVLAGIKRLGEDDDMVLDYPDRDGAVMLYSMNKQAGGQSGRASEVLNKLTSWADENNERLVLMPKASGELQQDALVGWYARNGFEPQDDGAMIRAPKPITSTTTTTEETASGVETPETQQTEAQGQTAPAVSTTPKTKRGRPTVLTEEQRKQKLTENKPTQAAKARAERSVNRILKSLEKLATPIDEGSFADDDALKAAQEERVSNRRQLTRELLALQGDPLLRGTKVAERVKAALEHPQISAKEKADIKKGMDLQKQSKNLYSKIGQGAADPKFAQFTTGSQALSHIIKTGNPFQRKLGRRLKSFVSGVKFVVIEKGQPLPEELQKSKNLRHWNRALALYTESYKTKEKVIYVRGASFGNGQGLNNVTILHELLHAATNRKITLALELIQNGMRLDSPLVQAANDLIRTMNSAAYRFNDMTRSVVGEKPRLTARMWQVVDIAKFGEAFTRPEEFIAYGLTDETMQEFLMTAEGYEEDDTFFNRFVRSIRDLFGMSDGDTNALSDLIVVTDRLLSAREPVGVRLSYDLISAMADHEKETAAKPGANIARMSKLLGSSLYGNPTDIAKVSIKELFQNAFDAVKESLENNQLGSAGRKNKSTGEVVFSKGDILITINQKNRTIRIVDNGPGMPSSVMGNQFLQIAGTVKGTSRASGGLGIAKMLFLFSNKSLEAVSLRDGVLSRLSTTGEELQAAMEDPTAPHGVKVITTSDPATVKSYTETLFPDGHGTSITVEIPETFVDPSTGEDETIRFDEWSLAHSPVLYKSPLFDPINVRLITDGHYGSDEQTLPIGSSFPLQDYTVFAGVKFNWGTARIYVARDETNGYGDNAHILSNGLWQFSDTLKDRPGWEGKALPYTFYIDVASAVKPEDAGYPFSLNRQNFSPAIAPDFEKIFNYMTLLYRQEDFAKSVRNFGTTQYLNSDGTVTKQEVLEPVAPTTDTAVNLIRPGDDVEIRDGVMYVNNRKVPELTGKDLARTHINFDELTIPQEDVDPRRVMFHDNTKQKAVAAGEDTEESKVERIEDLVSSKPDIYKFASKYISNLLPNKKGKQYNLAIANKSGGFSYLNGNVDEITQGLIDRGIFDSEAPESNKSLSDVARKHFGDDRYNKYIAEIGSTFMLLRDALVAAGGGRYADLAKEVIGTSVDIKYLGVSIIIPFKGMFINPCAISPSIKQKLGTAKSNTPEVIALAMFGTMQHELAHYISRAHDADFVDEFQAVMLVLQTFPGINLKQVEDNLTNHIKDNLDIFLFLHKEFQDGNFEARGNRFKDSSAQQIKNGSIPDDDTGASGAGELRQSLPSSSGKGAKDTGQVGISAGISGETEEVREAVRSQKEVDRAVAEAAHKFNESNKAEQFAKAVTLLQMAQDPRKVIPALNAVYNQLDVAARKFLVRIPTVEFLGYWASTSVPSLQYTVKLLRQMSGMTQQLLKSAGQLTTDVDRAFRKDPALREKLERITHVATLAEVDPADPSASERSARLDKMYADLGGEGQRVYKHIRDHFRTLSEYFSKLLDDQIANSRLTASEQKVLMKKIRAMYEKGPKITPYFSLVRRGDYWLRVGTGKNRKFYMRETLAERDRLMQALADEKIKRGSNESNKNWEARRAQNLGLLLEDQEFVHGNDITSLRKVTVDNSEMLRGIFTLIEDSDFQDADAKESLKDATYQIYLQTMPEQSFRKQFIHREGLAGFAPDLLRNVATTAAKMATQLARIKYSPLLRNSLSQARDSIANRPEQEPFVAEMEARVRDSLKFADNDSVANTVAKWLNKAAYVYYLGGASTALIQPLSIFQQGMPVLSKYGVVNANREMLRMLKVWQHFGVYVKNPDGSQSWAAPSIEHGMGLSPDERWAVRQMVARDVASSTFTGSVFDYKETPTGNHSAPIVQFGKDTVNMLVLGGLMHSTERLSRESLFLASFRLNRQAGKTKEEAVDGATYDTNEALGNYGDYNRPLWMKSATGRVLTQFMFYSLHVTLFLLKNFKEMIKPMDGHTRGEAAKKFFGTLAATYVLAGVVGLPMFSTIMGMLGWAWDELREEDWPEDIKSLSFELWFRTIFLPEMLGGTKIGDVKLADVVERGPVNAFTGMDISSRTSLNNIWLRETKEEKTIKDTAIAFAVEHIGPSPNMLLAWAEAWEAFSNGDLDKGVRKLAPAGFRNVVTANNLWKEGAKDSKGAQILSKDAFSTGLLIAQAVGFRSDLLANTQYVTFKVIGIEQKILNERQLLLNNMEREFKNKEFKKFNEILSKDIVKWNRKFPTYPIEGDDIQNSIAAKAEQRATSFRGVTLTEQNVPLFIKALGPSRKAAVEAEKKGREQKEKK